MTSPAPREWCGALVFTSAEAELACSSQGVVVTSSSMTAEDRNETTVGIKVVQLKMIDMEYDNLQLTRERMTASSGAEREPHLDVGIG